jgi:signal recognition particle subunit SRP54
VSEVNSLVDRFFEARKMMQQMAGGMGLPGMRRGGSKTRGKKGKKGKGRGPTPPKVRGGMPALPPGALNQLPPGMKMPDLSKLDLPKGRG